MEAVVNAAQQFSLDFDDAYQLASAQKQGFTLITFDRDFTKTGNIALHPVDAIKEL